jgi:DNA-binding transcriptional ArsR family regulator
METYQTQTQLFKVLMHPTRLAILEELRDGEQCVCHMEAKFGLRQAYISQHLMVLRDAGLVTDRRDGWNIYYQVDKPGIFRVIDAMKNMTDTSNSIQTGGTQSNISPSEKPRPCPCPKCNAGSEANLHESQDLALNEVEATV